METQCQTRQLIAGWSKHLASRLSTAEVNHCTLKCQNEGTPNNICEVNGGGYRSMWKMFYWLFDVFA